MLIKKILKLGLVLLSNMVLTAYGGEGAYDTSIPQKIAIDKLEASASNGGEGTRIQNSRVSRPTPPRPTPQTPPITTSKPPITIPTPPVNSEKSTVTTDVTSLFADGTATGTITVIVKDVRDRAIINATVTLSQGTGSSSISTVTSHNDGTYTFTITSTKSETLTYTAVANGITITQSVDVTFIPAPVDATLSAVTVTPSSLKADATQTTTITVTVKDTSDLLMNDATVTLSQGTGSSSISTVTTHNDGTYTFTITSTKAETVTYTTIVNGVTITQSVDVTFTPGAVDSGVSSITATPISFLTDGTAVSTITITLSDTHENLINNASVSLSQDINASTISAVTNHNDGTYTFNVSSTSSEEVPAYDGAQYNINVTKAEEVTYRASTEYTNIIQTVKVDFVRAVPLLIVRIEFNDYKFQSDAGVWSQKVFGMNEGEVNHYFNEVSYQQFRFIKAEETDGDTDGVITVSLDQNHPNIAKWLDPATIRKADDFIDFSKYDRDNNLNLSHDELQVLFIVAGGERSSGSGQGVNAHASPFDDTVILDNIHLSKTFFYSVVGERHRNWSEGNTHDATIGTIAHELGHSMFFLPDLYLGTDIGDFGLMGSGGWAKKNADELSGATPSHMTGWSKMKCGFVTPTVIENATDLQVNATALDAYELFKVESGNEGEYFIIENRANRGYDRGLWALEWGYGGEYLGGLSILHINNKFWSGIHSGNSSLVVVEDAANLGHSYKKTSLFYAGNNDSFTPTSTPNSNRMYGQASGISITNISNRGDVMSVDIVKE